LTPSFHEMLRTLRERAGLNMAEVAQAVGITRSAIGNFEKGYTPAPPLERVRQLAAALNATPAETQELLQLAALERAPEEAGIFRTLGELHYENHDAPQKELRAPLPLYGKIPAGPPDEVVESGEVYHVLLHQAKTGRYVLRVEGSSMAPSIQDGDLVLMEFRADGPVRAFHNNICAVRCGGETTLKRVQVQTSGEHEIVILKGDRPDYPTDTFLVGDRDFEIVGVALEIVRRELT